MLSTGYSLLLIAGLFLLIYAANYGYLYLEDESIDTTDLMTNIMGTIFIVFGCLKLVNLNKFVEIFSKYDIVSKHVKGYGFVYPFIEIIVGISLLTKNYLVGSYITTFALMIISLVGVVTSLMKGLTLRCGCLGSFFHIPLSYVTISENVVMLIMSGYLLL